MKIKTCILLGLAICAVGGVANTARAGGVSFSLNIGSSYLPPVVFLPAPVVVYRSVVVRHAPVVVVERPSVCRPAPRVVFRSPLHHYGANRHHPRYRQSYRAPTRRQGVVFAQPNRAPRGGGTAHRHGR